MPTRYERVGPRHLLTVQIINLLLQHYNENPKFRRALSRLHRKHRQSLRGIVELGLPRGLSQSEHTNFEVLSELGDPPAELDDPREELDDPREELDDSRAREYVAAMKDFAKRWGLQAPWGGEVIHQALESATRRGVTAAQFPEFETMWTLPEPQPPQPVIVEDIWAIGVEPPKSVEERIRTKARAQMALIRRKARAQMKLKKTPAAEPIERPRELDRNVNWLYQRVALRERWPEIYEPAGFASRTVRDAVEKLAKRIFMTLPDIPPGAPRKQ